MARNTTHSATLLQGLTHQAENLIGQHAKIIPLRYDLYYPKDSQRESRQKEEVQTNDINELMTALTHDYKILGYTWTMEINWADRIFYRVLIYLDGYNANSESVTDKAIDKLWRDIVGKRCEKYNRNSSTSYPFWNTGELLNYNDQISLDKLYEVLLDFCTSRTKSGLVTYDISEHRVENRGRPRIHQQARMRRY